MAGQAETMRYKNEGALLAEAGRLKAAGLFEDAETVLIEGRLIFPASFAIAEAWARAPIDVGDFDETSERLGRVAAEFPNSSVLQRRLFDFPLATGRTPEADTALANLAAVAGGSDTALAGALRLAIEQGRLNEAIAIGADLRRRFPLSDSGYTLTSAALRKLGYLDEASAVLALGAILLRDAAVLLPEQVATATALGDWQGAFDRLFCALRRHPEWEWARTALGQMLILWRLAVVENDPKAMHVSLPLDVSERVLTDVNARIRSAAAIMPGELAMRFESLGHGCEFGLVQRRYGAEPLGLLRWSNINPHQLCTLLRTRLEGVGDPEHAFVQVIGDEYFIGDSRYFVMHSFMKVGEIAQDQVQAKAIQRMRYLRDELLADLEAGEKTFVFKPPGPRLSADEIECIFGVFQACFPKAAVLVVHTAAEPQHIGTIRVHGPGCFEAFLDKMNVPGEEISYELWLDVCRKVETLRAATR